MLATAALSVIAAAQQIPEQELRFDTQPYATAAALRIHRDVIQVDVVVRDAKGKAADGLKEEDFKIYDAENSVVVFFLGA